MKLRTIECYKWLSLYLEICDLNMVIMIIFYTPAIFWLLSCHQSHQIFDVAAPVVDNVTTSVCEGGNLGSLFLLSQSWNTQDLPGFYKTSTYLLCKNSVNVGLQAGIIQFYMESSKWRVHCIIFIVIVWINFWNIRFGLKSRHLRCCAYLSRCCQEQFCWISPR